MSMSEKSSELYHLAWGYAEFDKEYLEKPTYERRCVVALRIFSELMVEEFIKVCTKHDANDCVNIIKKHFEVKEN